MVISDVYVPSIDKTYNFALDEDVPVGSIIAELLEMIEQREQTLFVGDRGNIALIDKKASRRLPSKNTLKECNVATGSTLYLV